MAGQGQNYHFIERILQLLHLLEEHGLEIDQISAGDWPSEGLSSETARELRTAYESIRFMDEMPGGFFIYYARGEEQIIYANRGVLRMFQCDTLKEFRELTGNSFRGVVCSEDLEAVENAIRRQIFSDQKDLDHVEFRIRRKDGSLHWVEDYGHFVRGNAEDSSEDVFYVFLGDATDERSQQQMEQKRMLSEALERADSAVKAKNAFLSHISHEMRTPLNAIFGFTTLAKTCIDIGDTASVAEYLDQVEIASRQLLEMVTKSLEVSKSNAAGVVQEECDLRETLQEIYDFLLPQAQEKSIDLSLDCEGVVHRGVYTDTKRLKQLVLNLTNNAITYTGEGGKVKIVLVEEKSLPDDHVLYRLEVQDTGIGIGEEFLEDVFEPFTRAKSSTLSGVRGIGLGLTIAKNIVDALDGTIKVKTAVNEGSTFIVTFPFRVQTLTDASGGKQGEGEIASSLHILLVEDNEISREIEAELLQRMGLVVIPVADGKQALDRMRFASPGDYDVIILDIQMPGMSGWEVTSAIRALPDPVLARTPIIALSNHSGDDDRRQSMESGVDVHLPKPMDLNVLLETIEKLTKKPINRG